MSLTHSQKIEYERDGFLLVEGLLTVAEIETLRVRAEAIGSGKLTHIPQEWMREESAIQGEQEGGPSGLDRLRKLEFLAWYDDLYLALAKHPRILAVVESLLDTSDLKLLADEMFMKPPVHGSAKEYHQDATSWPWLVPQAWVTAWLALDDVTLENGALQMVAGSHKLGMVPAECVGQVGDRRCAGTGGDGAGEGRGLHLPAQPLAPRHCRQQYATPPPRPRHALHSFHLKMPD